MKSRKNCTLILFLHISTQKLHWNPAGIYKDSNLIIKRCVYVCVSDLNDLGRGGWFFSKVAFFKSVHQAEKDELCLNFVVHFLEQPIFYPASKEVTKKWLKSCIFKWQTTKPRHSSSFSGGCNDLKNVIFIKIHPDPSEVNEVKRSFSRSLRSNFSFHLVFICFHLEFLFLRLFDLSDLSDLSDPGKG